VHQLRPDKLKRHPAMQLGLPLGLYLLANIWLAVPASGQVNLSFISAATNSASYGVTIAQGSMFVVFGENLGPAQLVQAGSYPLPPQIGGTSINVTSGSTTLACPMVYSSAGVAAAILPSTVPAGSAMLALTYNGQTTPFPLTISVAASAVGIYTLGSSGLGPGIFTALDGSVKRFAVTAQAGETVTAWATGLGPISGPDNVVPSTFPNFPGVDVFVGTQAANVIYAGRSGCCAGIDQISFQIPAGVTGCYVPVAIRSGGTLSNVVSIAVSSGGGPCSDSAPTVPVSIMNQASAGQPVKVAALAAGPVSVLRGLGFDEQPYIAQKLSKLLRVNVSPQDVQKLLAAEQTHNQRALSRAMSKYAAAWKALSPAAKVAVQAVLSANQEGAVADFGEFNTPATLAGALGALFPSQGTCATLQSIPFGSGARGLDAGASLALSGPAGSFTLVPSRAGQYQAIFGSVPAGPNLPVGAYAANGTGGHDLPAFSATLNVGGNILWTNQAAVTTVDRTQPLTVTWSGGTIPGFALIGGYVNSNTIGLVGFVCTEDTSKGSFTIPSFILSNLPAAARGGGLFISPHPLSHQITIPGVDLAYFMDGSKDSKSVVFK
jgi:uncharacterized protein (TIGR03437 family)